MKSHKLAFCAVAIWLSAACTSTALSQSTPQQGLPDAPSSAQANQPSSPDLRHRTPPTHRFFDRTNVALLTGSVLAHTANAITTHRAYTHCLNFYAGQSGATDICSTHEQVAFTRPFLRAGAGGQVALVGLSSALGLGITYAFHKTHHHRIERWVPVIDIAGATAAAAYDIHNDTFPQTH